MSSSQYLGRYVGMLSTYDPQTGKSSNALALYSNEDIYVGRDWKRCKYVLIDRTASNRHLWIYTVIFDHEYPERVAPLVYAQDLSKNGTAWNGYPVSYRQSFLLSDGDILQVSPSTFLKYSRRGSHVESREFEMLNQVEMRVFEKHYIVTRRKLGAGAFGAVHMAFHTETGRQLACKIIDIRAMKNQLRSLTAQEVIIDDFVTASVISPDENKEMSKKVEEKVEIYDREALILSTLEHPNIISMEKVIKSNNTIYIFQELVTGGDLFSYLDYKGGKLDDIQAAVIIRQILMALDYLHDRNIVHRDLKPENILMTSRADGCRVVVTDFGCARVLPPSTGRASTVVGTLEFSAPEVIRAGRQGYTKAIDLWSVGAVAVVLLTGSHPFESLDAGFITKLNAHQQYQELDDSMERNKVGTRARDFVRRLLVFDDTARMDVKQALQHEWFTNQSHKADFEALYQRSISDWRPQAPDNPVVVELKSFFEKEKPTPHTTRSPTPCESPKNTRPPPSQASESPRGSPFEPGVSVSSYGLSRGISQTLSDLNLPPYGNFDETEARLPGSSQGEHEKPPKKISSRTYSEQNRVIPTRAGEENLEQDDSSEFEIVESPPKIPDTGWVESLPNVGG